MKRWSSSLIREIKIKTTVKYHFKLDRRAITEKSKISNSEMGMEKKESSYIVGGNVSWYSHCGEKYGHSSEKPKF